MRWSPQCAASFFRKRNPLAALRRFRKPPTGRAAAALPPPNLGSARHRTSPASSAYSSFPMVSLHLINLAALPGWRDRLSDRNAVPAPSHALVGTRPCRAAGGDLWKRNAGRRRACPVRDAGLPWLREACRASWHRPRNSGDRRDLEKTPMEGRKNQPQRPSRYFARPFERFAFRQACPPPSPSMVFFLDQTCAQSAAAAVRCCAIPAAPRTFSPPSRSCP